MVGRYIVKARTQSAREAAHTLAREVHGEMGFNDAWLILGSFTATDVETLRSRDDVEYVEEEGQKRVPSPPGPGDPHPSPEDLAKLGLIAGTGIAIFWYFS